ncbi:MAG: peptidylprolyl isomerase [Planctomycetes bacterium]|nr:peptidylprolyl isomerase [Planctomycetota bacterium]
MLLTLALLFLQTPASRPAGPETRPAGAVDTVAVAAIADKVVGIINNEVITKSEIDSRLASLIATQGTKDPSKIAELWQDEKRKLAVELLLTQAAKKLAFDDKLIEDGVKRRMDELGKRAGNLAALQRKVESQGISFAEFERDQRNRELTERLWAAEVGHEYRPEKEIVITPALLRNYYKEHLNDFQAGPMVRGRVVSISDAKSRTHENALVSAKDVLERLKKGVEFADVARELSEFRPQYGGEITWIERNKGSLEPSIEEFMFTRDVHETSGVIEVDHGVAIVKIEAKRPAGLRPFRDQDTQEEVARAIYMGQSDKLKFAMLKRLQAEAYIWPPDLFTGK